MGGKKVAYWEITYIDDKGKVHQEGILDKLVISEFDNIEEYQEMDPYEVISDYVHYYCKEVLNITPIWENL